MNADGFKSIIVEDDKDVRDQMVAFLSLSGLNVVGVGSAAELYRAMAVERYAVVILDLGLPDEDGLSIATYLRKKSNVGIIITSARTESADRISGAEAGADSYMNKPFDLNELVLAVRNLARRVGPMARPTLGQTPDENWVFDRAARSLAAPNGCVIRLTSHEYAIMISFLQKNAGVVAKRTLLAAIGASPSDPDSRSLDTAIRRLRLKISEQTGMSLPIQTVHGVGYAFEGKISFAGAEATA